MAAPLDTLQSLGYTAEPARTTSAGITMWWVDGPGLGLYVRDDDDAAWASITDPTAVSERESQLTETTDETLTRLYGAPTDTATPPPA